jgi:GNAT superfamily N-acetyltransferase
MLTTRRIREDDIDVICSHRARMFQEAGASSAAISTMIEAFRGWIKARLDDGSYFGFVVEENEVVVAGVGLMLIAWPPHPLHPETSQRGYVLNVFVEPSHRGRGIAQELMNCAEAEFREHGVQYLVLHATEAGRPLYRKLGWTPTSEMAKAL